MFLLKLRSLLLYNYLYLVILIITLIITILRIILDEVPIINSEKKLKGIISSYSIDGNRLTLDFSNYKIKAFYYISSQKEKNKLDKIKLGDIYLVEGEVSIPNEPTTKGLFNYKNYLKTKKVNYTMNVLSLEKVGSVNNIYYLLKNFIQKRFNKNPYLYTFILGDKSYLSNIVTNSYQENGISHLFAISGMHISLLSDIILKILKKLKLKQNVSYLITSLILFIYLLLVGPAPSILRGVLFFYLFTINNIFYFYIKNTNIYVVVLAITLFVNPFYIYDIGFIYSFAISLALLLTSNYLKSNNYFIGLLKTSFISFIVSLPISLYISSSMNLLSIIYNLFFVPFISFIVFPLSLLTFIFPFLVDIFNFFTYLVENISLFLENINFGRLIFMRFNIIYYIFLEIFIFYIITHLNASKYFIILLMFFIIHYFFPYLKNDDYLKLIDVGQGDSILLYSNNEAALIDTGGKASYNTSNWQKRKKQTSLANGTIIPILKQLGIKKLKYLIITHGDFDHAGEALNLLKDIKIDNIIINSNELNSMEKEIINNYHGVVIGIEGTTFNVGKFRLIQLNENLVDENDSSQIYYVLYKNIKILLMGDASIKSEYLLLDKYLLEDIDILKIGHHGSKTSTSSLFLEQINPNVALISVGKDNKFNHPHNETIRKLKENNISYYRTDISGTITIDLNNIKIYQDK